jgi:hypothetical protein
MGELWDLQQEYPYVEWGVLVSQNWKTNGNRYFNPGYLLGLARGLNLSAHLCGNIARAAVKGNMSPFADWAKGDGFIFDRCQLNISNSNTLPDKFEFSNEISSYFDEVILQQKGINDCDFYLKSQNPDVSILLDASGGNGINTPIEIPDIQGKIGYAGGINQDNVADKLTYLIENSPGPFWIDMESGVRTNDWFDTDKVKNILKICDNIIKKYE